MAATVYHSTTSTPLHSTPLHSPRTAHISFNPPPLTLLSLALHPSLSSPLLAMSTSYWRLPMAPKARYRSFSSDFCDCCSDCSLCVYGCFCCPCLSSEISAKLDNNPNRWWCCYPSSTSKNRRQAKAQFAISEHCCMWLCVCFFPCCSEIQVIKEIRAHTSGVSPDTPQYMQMQ